MFFNMNKARFMLSIKQYRLLSLPHFKREYSHCNESTQFNVWLNFRGSQNKV